MSPDFRCSAASLEAVEPLEGTASTVRTFLLLEAHGPWGVDAIRHGRIDAAVSDRLAALESGGVRPLLIRRPRRTRTGTTHLFACHVGGGTPWLGATTLDDPGQLLDLDLAGLADGRGRSGFEPHAGPLFLACTHGRHDACCAELGRPLAAALAAAAPEETWEVSHIGGDRFAPNVLVLPYGLYYGRLLPAEAPAFVETHRDGRLDLEHLRGRSTYPFAVQAAEIHLRRHLDHDAVEPLRLVSRARASEVTTAVFDVDGTRWQVQVRTTRSEPSRLTCRSTSPSAPLSHTLVAIEPGP